MFNRRSLHFKSLCESACERILKIGSYLPDITYQL